MPRLIIVLAPGFEETEAVTVIDLLRRAGITVTLLGLESTSVRGSHGITISADAPLTGFTGAFDGIVLPGGMPGTTHLAESPTVLDLVRAASSRGGLCAAICAAPMVLAKAGILTGVKATCYPGLEGRLGSALFLEQAVVRDKNIITSRGVGTAIPFALEIIDCLAGKNAAEKVREGIVYE
jgi:4-methyl-5(b-hydroxyethyl)-thiazole monophosphate biosynthesis